MYPFLAVNRMVGKTIGQGCSMRETKNAKRPLLGQFLVAEMLK